MGEEEVRRVTDALNAVEKIEEREERIKAQSKIMAEQANRNKDWSQDRDELVRELWDNGSGLSYRQIAARLEIKLSTVQAVFRGKGSGTTRPKSDSPRTKKPAEE
jgi:DNA-directed RNA polymerase specialized sigma24 family protein